MTAALPRTPSLRLDGKRALVTGAGRGLGLACAAALCEAGAEVWLAARSANEVQAAALALRARGDRAHGLVLDVTDTAAVAQAVAAHGPFQVLVNNAGTNRPKPIAEVTADDYAAVFDLNVRALYVATQAVVKRLLAAGKGGSIINISSQMGHVGGPNRSLYCGSKHAVEGITKALAVELAPKGIRVNAIAPTFIETAMTRPYFEVPGFKDQVLGKIPLGRLGQVEDIMGAVAYLASDASALVTGTSLVVDGGWTAQ
jgi:NAD(P)-dependent dehydrogenase (short-subunit alcohol dehydrogenase family)